MNKQKKKLPYSLKLTVILSVYAAVFVCVGYFGFSWFWDYIQAYENSRPAVVIEAYVEQFDPQDAVISSQTMISDIDHNIQNKEQCVEAVKNAVSGGISYARNLKECTDTTTVYMLLSNGKTVGKATLIAQEADEFGFTPWTLGDVTFDFSFLIGEGTSVTVPSDYTVYVNGVQLSQDYITETNIYYEFLEEYYDRYALPYMVTYSVEPILGDLEVTVADPHGNPVTPEAWADPVAFLSTATDTQLAEIKSFSRKFIVAYVNYTTNSGGADRHENYATILPYLVPNTPLRDRIDKALDGLSWVSPRQAEVHSVNIDQCIPTQDGYMLCTVTYRFSAINITYDRDETTITAQLVLKDTGNGYKVESFSNN